MSITDPPAVEIAVSDVATQDASFREFRWKKRILLIFASAGDWQAQTQRQNLDTQGFADRDLVIVAVPNHGRVQVSPTLFLDAETLRRAYGMTETASFSVLLIGKDGGVKLRSDQPISATELFETIDAMPMRRREMRER